MYHQLEADPIDTTCLLLPLLVCSKQMSPLCLMSVPALSFFANLSLLPPLTTAATAEEESSTRPLRGPQGGAVIWCVCVIREEGLVCVWRRAF